LHHAEGGVELQGRGVEIRLFGMIESCTPPIRLAEYRQQGRKSIKTAEWRWKKHLEPFFHKLPADDLNTDVTQRYCAKREEEKASGASINRELAILKRAFHLAMKRTPPKVRACPVIPMCAHNHHDRSLVGE
jgi:hypothetical protein